MGLAGATEGGTMDESMDDDGVRFPKPTYDYIDGSSLSGSSYGLQSTLAATGALRPLA